MNKFAIYAFPSQNNDVLSLRNILGWSTRVFSVYSLLLFELIHWNFNAGKVSDVNIFLALFFLQAAILMYVFQSYRRLFVLSGLYEKNLILALASFFWLFIFFLYNVTQVTFGLLIASQDIGYWLIVLNLIPILLSLAGEYLFRRTNLS